MDYKAVKKFWSDFFNDVKDFWNKQFNKWEDK
jgi:hypothetical protein